MKSRKNFVRKPRQPLALAVSLIVFQGTAWAQDSTTEPINVEVKATRFDADAAVVGKELDLQRAANPDTATLMSNISGVAFQVGGAVSSIPVIRGLADNRINTLVDGIDAVPSCPNHMNTPLSYVDPSSIKSLTVYKSLKPVSVGLNSIGGAIVASTGQPTFSEDGKSLVTGNAGFFYGTNNNNIGGNLSVTAATDWISLTYTGSTSSASNYTAGGNFHQPQATTGTTANGPKSTTTLPPNMVGSTSYESTNQSVALALKHDRHTAQLQYSWQDIPYENYPNQRMDLTGNQEQRFNLRYWGGYDWGKLEGQAYYETLNHTMNFGPNKQYYYGATGNVNGMPMNTSSNTSGVKIKGDIHLSEGSLVRTGAEWQRYYLNDWWPPVANAMMMGPNTFQNINGGLQQISSLFGEWEKQFDPRLKSLLGVRYSLVNSSTGNVQGYTNGNMMGNNEATDAAAFNGNGKYRNFNDVDITLTTSYKHSANQEGELGLARQVRAPNLYELYSWSTSSMNAVMNNFVGDGNGYFGNPNLKAETAYTASAAWGLHTADRDWMVKASPFYSYVQNYIDAVQWSNCTTGMGMMKTTGPCPSTASPATTLRGGQFNVMQYVNQNANLAGFDLDGQMPIAKTDFGRFSAQGLFNWTYGKNLVTGYGLYNVMPVNGKVNLTHQYGGWDNQLQFVAVANKNNFLSVERNEIATPGYFLTNLKASYSWSKTRIDAGINNVFNTLYYQPLGGAYLGQGATMGINSVPYGVPVPGMGISYYTALNVKF